MGIKLKIDDEDVVSMPACFADSTLTVAEIGALFCFTAMSETGIGVARFESACPDFIAAAEGLKNKGVLTFKRTDRTIRMIFDYEKVEPDPRFRALAKAKKKGVES